MSMIRGDVGEGSRENLWIPSKSLQLALAAVEPVVGKKTATVQSKEVQLDWLLSDSLERSLVFDPFEVSLISAKQTPFQALGVKQIPVRWLAFYRRCFFDSFSFPVAVCLYCGSNAFSYSILFHCYRQNNASSFLPSAMSDTLSACRKSSLNRSVKSPAWLQHEWQGESNVYGEQI